MMKKWGIPLSSPSSRFFNFISHDSYNSKLGNSRLVGLAVLTALLQSKIQQGLKLNKIFIFNKRPHLPAQRAAKNQKAAG